jgi:Ca-activated chloride channel family protein
MQQAIDAAVYIVENLNESDSFNIVDFSSSVSTFAGDHLPVNPTNQQSAISYIEQFYASGLTNISVAFEQAIPDFSGNDTTIANIIIFLTDGQATTGITSTPDILQYIQNLVNYNEINNLAIHTFGIGDDVNQQLLSQIASQNNGLCHFLENEELLEAITAFYNSIQNPVLLNPEMAIDPPIINETYPNPLPNLYLGQQLIVTGRYSSADSVTVTFSGEAFGQQQEYIYGVQLSDTIIPQNQFLTKLWAKGKMENLYVLYFTYPPESPEAEEIREEIINISICYNVISPFTSYSGGGGGGGSTYVEEEVFNEEESEAFCKAYPNPFRGSTVISLKVDDNFQGPAFLRIYDNTGKLLHLMAIGINGNGQYEFRWDGRDSSGNILKAGMYFYTITRGKEMYCGRVYRI